MSPQPWRYVLVGCFWFAAVAHAKELYAVKLTSVEKAALLTLEIDFFGAAPAADTIAKIVQSGLQTASALDATKDIAGSGFSSLFR